MKKHWLWLAIVIVSGIVIITILWLFVMKKSSEKYESACVPLQECKCSPDNLFPMFSNYCDSGCNVPDNSNIDPDKKIASPQNYMCPNLMLGSEDLRKAAEKDGNDWSYYGVATHFNDKSGCGRCYQLSYLPYCGEYWAEKSDAKDGPLCCYPNPDKKECGYSNPYGCFQSQLRKCCLDGTCDVCKEWSGPSSTKLPDENPDESLCKSKGGTFCPGWCTTCRGQGGDCDKCVSFPTKPLIVQSFNTGIDCTPPDDDSGGQFDIYMGAGGLGANVGCADPDTVYQERTFTCSCENKDQGKPPIVLGKLLKDCKDCKCDETQGCDCSKKVNCVRNGIYGGGFYGGALDLWPDYIDGKRNGGATRIDMCDEIGRIDKFRNEDSDWPKKNWGKELIQSCKFALGDENPYHGNWAVRFKEVECPKGLTDITGLRLKDSSTSYTGKPLPKPSPTLVKPSGREGSVEDGYPGFTSTMMDCCKPSCAVNDMVMALQEKGFDVDKDYRSIWMCDGDGNRIGVDPTFKDRSGLERAYTQGYDSSGHVTNRNTCFNTKTTDGTPIYGLCPEGLIADNEPNCNSDEECCSQICSKAEYSSMCCPMFQKPDGKGNCVFDDSEL